jgi:hypothetical protein
MFLLFLPHALQVNAGIVILSGHNHFFSDNLQFIIHLSTDSVLEPVYLSRYSVWATGCMTDESGFDSRDNKEISLHSTVLTRQGTLDLHNNNQPVNAF